MSKLFLLLAFSLVMLPIRYLLLVNDHRRIHQYLKQRNCEAIDISWHPNKPLLSRSRGGSYDVLYVNAKNELYRTRCYVEDLVTLFWTESTFLYVASPERIERLRRMGGFTEDEPYTAKSAKEKVIDGLTSVFKYERLWAVKSVLTMNEVDDQVRQIVKNIASNDEEPEVREVATKIMNQL
ncbi:MAG: hypothetical protein H6657_28375 [Ardenticatenaceae bacterium]|nr:hypothetical protein [Ardenticatenaceae bacterium]